MKKAPLLISSALSLSLFGCSSGPSIGSQQQPIINGTADTGDPAVALAFAYNQTGMRGGICTATLISPHVMLTAAHCLDPAALADDAGTPTLAYFASSKNSIDFSSGMLSQADFDLAVQSVDWDPDFDISTVTTTGHDIGVIILQTASTNKPVPVNHTALASLTGFQGSNVRVIGYGITSGTDTTGKTAGTKMQTPIAVNSFDNNFILFQDNMHGICEGDSGGPALAMVNGVETIVGTTDFGSQGCPVTMPSADARVDIYAAEIDAWVNKYDPGYNTNPGANGGGGGSTAGGGGSTSGGGGGSTTGGGGTGSAGGGGSHKSGGCSMGGEATAASGLLMLLPLGLLARRRRRSA